MFQKLDIAICENMLSGIENKYKVIKKDGMFIIKCSDEVSIFYNFQ